MCNAPPPAAPRRSEHGVYQRTAGRVPQALRTEQPEGGVQISEWCQKQSVTSQGFLYILRFSCKSREKESQRAESNRLPLLITSDRSHVAEACKPRISRGFSLPCLAPCCPVLRSRWYQSGIRRLCTTRRSFLRRGRS